MIVSTKRIQGYFPVNNPLIQSSLGEMIIGEDGSNIVIWKNMISEVDLWSLLDAVIEQLPGSKATSIESCNLFCDNIWMYHMKENEDGIEVPDLVDAVDPKHSTRFLVINRRGIIAIIDKCVGEAHIMYKKEYKEFIKTYGRSSQ